MRAAPARAGPTHVARMVAPPMARPLARTLARWAPPLLRPPPGPIGITTPWPRLPARRAASSAAAAGGGGGDAGSPAAQTGRVIDTELRVEAEKSYIAYAMSVIVGRALPDVRDGLKPVHRRILYAMHGLGLGPTTPYRKCARVVGEVLGKYHPHGDTAVYDALVRLAQDFSMRAPLVAGHGNFGSLDADPPAAMRYTECRLTPVSADVLLRDLGADTVDMAPNFDGSVEEPTVMPARVPLLLVNGSSGIAVGIATRVPPHNLGEVVGALRELIANPDATTADLMRHVPAPDFPTGGEILGMAGVREAYETGRGPVTVRGRVEIETDDGPGAKKRRAKRGAAAAPTATSTNSLDGDEADDGTASSSGRSRIVITELPYQTNKAAFVTRVAELVDDGTLPGVSDVRDESDRSGMRVVVEVRRGAYPRVVLNTLYKTTALQTRFSVNTVALVNGTPRTLPLKECLQHFLEFRKGVVERRARHELGKAERRAHIVAGLLLAQADLDGVVKTIRAAADAASASIALRSSHGLSEEQAEAVLAMALRRLTSLEAGKLRAEADDLAARVADLKDLLASPARVLKVIEDEAMETAAKFGNPRRSTLNTGDDGDVTDESLVPDGESIVVFSRRGFIKRMAADTFSSQARGGRGKAGAGLRGDHDGVGDVLAVRNHDTVLFFTRDGAVRSLRAHQIPEASRSAAGTAITKVLNVARGDAVAALLATREFSHDDGLLLLTRNGLVKRTALNQFKAVRANGMVAIKLREGTGDELVWVDRSPPGARVLLAASDGQALLFAADSLRSSSRASTGVVAMRLSPGASLVGMSVLPAADVRGDGPGPSFLVITKQGYGKRVPVADFRDMARANRGVRAIRLADGDAVAALLTLPAGCRDDLLIGTASGVMLRMPQAAVREAGRGAKGVRVVRLDEGDSVQNVTTLEADVGDGDGDLEAAPPSSASKPPKKAPPKSAYFAFCAATRPEVAASMPGARLADVSRALAERWRALSDAEKAAFKAQA